MTNRKQRSTAQPLLDNHQRCWIWGRNAVMETLEAGRWRMWEILADERFVDGYHEKLTAGAKRMGAELRYVDSHELERICKSKEHQGLIAKMSPFPYEGFEELMERWEVLGKGVTVLLLEGIEDSFNLGAIVRAAVGLGVDGVLIPEKGQVGVNSLVARSSAGMVNHVAISRVVSLSETIDRLKENGYRVTGATGRDYAVDLGKVSFTSRTAIVLGREASGLSVELEGKCDEFVRIPLNPCVESLNAAVAAGIICYEVDRQRREELRAP